MRRILLADSDPHVLLLCREELQDEGFEVLTVGNGREVLERLQQSCPDLVVLEMLLPDMSGFDILRQVKDLCPETPVVFHSIYGLPAQQCRPPVMGAAIKTHDLKGLKRLIQHLLPVRAMGHPHRSRDRQTDTITQEMTYGYYGN